MLTLAGLLVGVLPAIAVGLRFHGGVGFAAWLFGFGPLTGVAFGLSGPRLDARRCQARQRRLRRAAKREASSLPPASTFTMAGLADGPQAAGPGLRLRGRVRVIDAVVDPVAGESVAAAIDRQGGRVCGRFEVIGEVHTGVVEGGLLELWDDDAWRVVVHDGDHVEIAGPIASASERGTAGYRGTAKRIVFGGHPRRPVHVFRLAASK